MCRRWPLCHFLVFYLIIQGTALAQSFDLKDAATRAADGVGIVGEISSGASNIAPIFIMQETHTSRVGQLQIAVMLNRLYEDYGLRNISLEGMTKPAGRLEAAWFHYSNPDIAIRDDVAVRMLGEGEISAAELMALSYQDINVFGAENQDEYSVNVNKSSKGNYLLSYLTRISERSMTQDQIKSVNTMIKGKKIKEATMLIVNSDPWVKKHYDEVFKRDDVQSHDIEPVDTSLARLREIEQKARDVSAVIDEDSKKDMRSWIAFYEAALRRSKTMVDKTIMVAESAAGAPVALMIGAAHTQGIMEKLKTQGLRFVLLTPIALTPTYANLTTEQFKRKNDGLWARTSPGTLGAVLNPNHKEETKLEKLSTWNYASMQLSSIIIANAARIGKKIPGDIWCELTRLPEITFNKGSFAQDGFDIIYSATLMTPDGRSKEVWARVGTVTNKQVAWSLEEKLLQSIAALRDRATMQLSTGGENISASTGSTKEEGPGDYQKDRKTGEKVIVERLNAEVVAVYGENEDAVTLTSRISS